MSRLATPLVTQLATRLASPLTGLVPGAPTIGTATAGNAQATVAFTPPGDIGGGPITGYRVTSSPGGITATGASSPITVTGLTNGTAYTFTVAAQNAGGYGPESAASNSVTPAVTDPSFASVTSLLSFDGTNGSTTFTDAKSRIWTPAGNAQISTAQSQFGGASGAFDGAGDHISTPYVLADFDWWNTDFTIECFIRPASLATWSYTDATIVPTLVGNGDPAGTTRFWSFGPMADGVLRFYYFNGAPVAVDSSTSVIGVNVWTHIAMVRSGTSIFLYANGSRVASATISGTPQSGTGQPLVIGQGNNTSINGFVDEFRVTRGVARYTGATYTVPTAAFPTS